MPVEGWLFNLLEETLMKDSKLNTGRVGAGKSAAISGSAESKAKGVNPDSATSELRSKHDVHPLKAGKLNKA